MGRRLENRSSARVLAGAMAETGHRKTPINPLSHGKGISKQTVVPGVWRSLA